MQCKITFGSLVKNARQENGFSQRELCRIITQEYHHSLTQSAPTEGSTKRIDHYLISKIENCRVDVRSNEYDWLIPAIAKIFDADIEWLEEIRQQTQVEPLDLSQAIFPVYFKP